MRKFILLLVGVASAVLFSGCKDFMVDVPAVHNGLVAELNALLLSEQRFYDASMALTEGADNEGFDHAYGAFVNSAKDVDDYYKNTTFHSTQQTFVDTYNQSYKPFLDKYLAAGKVVKDVIAKDGYNYDKMKDLIAELDRYSQDFVSTHDKLIDLINLQADKL